MTKREFFQNDDYSDFIGNIRVKEIWKQNKVPTKENNYKYS